MPEIARLSDNLDEIDVEFIEREATPRFLMKLSTLLWLRLSVNHSAVSRMVLSASSPVFGTLHGGAETLGDTV